MILITFNHSDAVIEPKQYNDNNKLNEGTTLIPFTFSILKQLVGYTKNKLKTQVTTHLAIPSFI